MSKTIEMLTDRKCRITGRVHKIEGIQAKKTGFSQRFMLHLAEIKDETTGRTIRREQYYWVQIWSREQTDKRFLDSRHIKELRSCSVYVNSYHWTDRREGLTSVVKLDFIEWLKVENNA